MPKVANVYTGPDGDSHFRDIEIPMPNADDRANWSKSYKASEFMFRGSPGQSSAGYHNVPFPQLVVMLEGEMEIEASDGTKRLFRPGQMILIETTTGRGSKSHIKDRVSLIIPLPEGQSLSDK